jgi:hypothetical protein
MWQWFRLWAWFALTPAFAFTLAWSSLWARSLQTSQAHFISNVEAVAQLPETGGVVLGITNTYEAGDARPILVANFLKRHNSPMTPHEEYGVKLVEIADRHGIDFRLVPAIAMQESNLCKATPPGSYNCLGFGVHSRGTLKFEKYEDGFERAARELKANYIDRGLDTPCKIMRKYTPSSNGSWCNSVNQWMSEMKFDDRAKGKADDADHNVLEYAVNKVEPEVEAVEPAAVIEPSPSPEASPTPSPRAKIAPKPATPSGEVIE